MRKSGKKYEIVVKSWKKWLKVGKTGEKLGKWRKVGISGESWGKEGKSGKKWQKVAKWRPPAILDDRKSLLIAFLAISDQYATFFFFDFFFKMAAGGSRSPICAKNNRVLPLYVINGYAKYEVGR